MTIDDLAKSGYIWVYQKNFGVPSQLHHLLSWSRHFTSRQRRSFGTCRKHVQIGCWWWENVRRQINEWKAQCHPNGSNFLKETATKVLGYVWEVSILRYFDISIPPYCFNQQKDVSSAKQYLCWSNWSNDPCIFDPSSHCWWNPNRRSQTFCCSAGTAEQGIGGWATIAKGVPTCLGDYLRGISIGQESHSMVQYFLLTLIYWWSWR